MPLTIDAPEGDPVDLAQFLEGCRELKLDAAEPEGLIAGAPLLKRLTANRRFFAQFLAGYLDAFLTDRKGTDHTGQVFPLGSIDDNHYGRACIWPSSDDEMYRKTGPGLFYYEEPHDHNFSFITIGYHGPGYRSDYYEVRSDTTDWHPGTSVELVPAGRKTLEPGKIFLYRKAIDVHSQIPPEQTSISVNIVAAKADNSSDQQHIFTRDVKAVSYVHHQRVNYPIFAAAASLDIDNNFERLARLSETHSDGFIRFYALKALASSKADPAELTRVMEKASSEDNAVLSGIAGRYLEAITAK